MPLKNHDLLNHPRCSLCGSANVREIGQEGEPDHRHVCLNINCVEIASNRIRAYHGLAPLYPELMKEAPPDNTMK
jgi:hypothetical protein